MNVGNIRTVMKRPSPVPSSWSQESRGTWSCHLTGRHGLQLSADVNVTLRVPLECGIVEIRRSCTTETKMNNTSVQRRRLAPTVLMSGERQSNTRNTESERPILAVSVIDARFQQSSQQWRACTVPQSQYKHEDDGTVNKYGALKESRVLREKAHEGDVVQPA